MECFRGSRHIQTAQRCTAQRCTAQRCRLTLLCHRCHARTVLQGSKLQHIRESNPKLAGARPTQVGHDRRGEKVRYRKADLTDKQRQERWRPRPDSESRALSRVERTPARSLCVALFIKFILENGCDPGGLSLANQAVRAHAQESPTYHLAQSQSTVKTSGKWHKCNLVSGMVSVASDMGWLGSGWIGPAPVR